MKILSPIFPPSTAGFLFPRLTVLNPSIIFISFPINPFRNQSPSKINSDLAPSMMAKAALWCSSWLPCQVGLFCLRCLLSQSKVKDGISLTHFFDESTMKFFILHNAKFWGNIDTNWITSQDASTRELFTVQPRHNEHYLNSSAEA